MQWSEIRQAYPDQWLIIEALEAHTTHDDRRRFDRLAVIESCKNGSAALKRYRQLHQQYPNREFYYFHTSREEVEVFEQQWLGIRISHAANPQA